MPDGLEIRPTGRSFPAGCLRSRPAGFTGNAGNLTRGGRVGVTGRVCPVGRAVTAGFFSVTGFRVRAWNYRTSFLCETEIGRSCLFTAGRDVRSLGYSTTKQSNALTPTGSSSKSPTGLRLSGCFLFPTSVRHRLAYFLRERTTMKNLRRTLLPVAALGVAVTLSGCCVTSISCRKAQAPCPNCQPAYEPIPQGIGPMDAPMDAPMDPAPPAPTPQPYAPPTPTTSNRSFGVKTTSAIRSFGDSVRDTFTR